MFSLSLNFAKIFNSIIHALSIDMMNDLIFFNFVFWVVVIPNIMGAFQITASIYGWVIFSFFMWNPNIKVSVRYPSTFEVSMFWAMRCNLLSYLFGHATWCFVGAGARTELRRFIKCMNSGKFIFAHLADDCSFHAVNNNMAWSKRQ